MTKEQAARNIALAEALESGKYKQGRGVLREGDCFCCIGVACDLLDSAGWNEDGCYLGKIAYAPRNVFEAYGWNNANPAIPFDGFSQSAADLNDEGRSFPEIAQGFRALAAKLLEAANAK